MELFWSLFLHKRCEKHRIRTYAVSYTHLDMASMIHNEMRKYGIKLVLGYTVEGFKEKDNGVEVLLKDNPSLPADMVVLAIGVTPVSYTHLSE